MAEEMNVIKINPDKLKAQFSRLNISPAKASRELGYPGSYFNSIFKTGELGMPTMRLLNLQYQIKSADITDPDPEPTDNDRSTSAQLERIACLLSNMNTQLADIAKIMDKHTNTLHDIYENINGIPEALPRLLEEEGKVFNAVNKFYGDYKNYIKFGRLN